MSSGKVIIVDDEEHIRLAGQQALELGGFRVESTEDPLRVPELVSRSFDGIVIADIRMPGMDGMTLMERLLEIDPELPVVLITGHGDVQLAVEAMRKGAYDFIEKPFASSHLAEVADRAVEKRRLTLEVRQLRSAVGGRDRLEARVTGRTPIMVDVRKRIRAIAGTDADVLITGETGTGKEVAARALHGESERRGKPFVAINCGALPPNLIESELFGHEAGAFPGAARSRYGKFEHARGGTVFLDEIESMPPELQVKLLRVIQDRSVNRLGSNDPVDLDVRFIAASKSDLEVQASRGNFRPDLLYRLNVVTLRMPAIEERRADIPRLFTQLAMEATARYRKEPPEIPSSVLSAAAARKWPGNVRELRNAAERYVLGLETEGGADGPEKAGEEVALADRLADFERGAIAAELTSRGGNLKLTYQALGLSRKTLYEKMQKYGLNREDFVRQGRS